MIEFPLYKSGKIWPNIFHYFIIGISLVLIIYFHPTIQSILVLVMIVGIALYITTSEKRNSVGKIYLTNQQIKIITDTNEFQSDLAFIDRLEIMYSGYNGKRVTGDFIPRYNVFSGTDNYIRIEKDNITLDYKFQVDNELQENEIIELVNQWGECGYDISNIRLNI